jgi:hypothetical protein
MERSEVKNLQVVGLFMPAIKEILRPAASE